MAQNTHFSDKTSLVTFDSAETLKVYESAEKPGHNQWPTAFLDKAGDLYVVFQNISGDLKQASSYDYRENPQNYRITRIGMKYDRKTGIFRQIWQREEKQLSFCIMAPHPAKSGKNLGICSGSAFPELNTAPGSMVVLETRDQGQTFLPLAVIPCPGGKVFAPNDIRCIGDKIYAAFYDGKGGVYLSESDDEGKTWSEPFKFADQHDNMSFHEPTFSELSNGDLLVVMRTHRMDIPKQNGINYHSVILSHAGKGKWDLSGIRDTGFGFRGRPYLMRTQDNILILACPGHFMAFSLNDGRTWESGLYDFHIPMVKFLDNGIEKDYNHNAETTLVELPDGRIYYSYFIGSDFPFPAPCDEYVGGTFLHLRRN